LQSTPPTRSEWLFRWVVAFVRSTSTAAAAKGDCVAKDLILRVLASAQISSFFCFVILFYFLGRNGVK
jgi:hypothetical protein